MRRSSRALRATENTNTRLLCHLLWCLGVPNYHMDWPTSWNALVRTSSWQKRNFWITKLEFKFSRRPPDVSTGHCPQPMYWTIKPSICGIENGICTSLESKWCNILCQELIPFLLESSLSLTANIQLQLIWNSCPHTLYSTSTECTRISSLELLFTLVASERQPFHLSFTVNWFRMPLIMCCLP